jgi:2-polyprenyl-6-methoxyphenol hydroxylase-like FAD-dependent oxidoreductase
VLFETISNIPNPDDRISLLSSLRHLLNSPGINGHPHRSGLLFLLESQSNFLDYDGKSVSRELLNLWRQLIRSCGYELVKQRTIESQNFPAIQAFVFATSSNATGDTDLSKNKMSSQLSPLKKLYVSRDYIIPSNSNVDNSEKITEETSKKKSAYKYKSSDAIIGIIGGGLGGTALGLALQQKGIPFKIFEKDSSFTSRKQGYALTIQQGATTLKSLGLLEKISSVGQLSLGHISLDHKGKILGAYDVKGLTKTKSLLRNIILLNPDEYLSLQNKHIESNNLNLLSLKRHNIHVPRQIVREIMMKEIHPDNIKWDCKLHHFEENSDCVSLEFTDKSEYKVNILVAADGIHSTVQKLLTSYSQSKQYQLQYLGLIVILGISPKISLCEHMNGYSRYQIQWVDGITRVFTMPYDDKHTMWQLSYPISESNAVLLSHRPDALKREALIRLKDWHSPLVQMVELTPEVDISGHPTYDRDPLMLEYDALNKYSRVTLLGDAAHPMSPFKGQGANQALLDVQSLSEAISSSDLVCSNGRPVSDRLRGKYLVIQCNITSTIIRIMIEYEKEMWTRSAPKVMKSREAARYLHSPVALARADITRAAAAEALLYSANSLTGFNELTRFE